MRNPAYISIVERTESTYHRSPIILHKDNMFYLAEFERQEQLDFFAETLGFTYSLREERTTPQTGKYRAFDIDRAFDDRFFWRPDELPADAKPIKALCNGSIVTCYFTNDGDTITFFRPNPNAEEVYCPMSLQEHRAHQTIYGKY